jgi:hypothetical protein
VSDSHTLAADFPDEPFCGLSSSDNGQATRVLPECAIVFDS